MYKLVSVPRLAALMLAVLSLLLFDKPFASAASDLVIGNYQLVSKTRVSRTEYEYTYKASITNNGTEEAVNIVGKVSSLASTTVVTDDSLTFGTIPVGATLTSSDTFKVKINLSYAFKSSNLSWNFLYDPNPGIPELMEGVVYPPEVVETMIINYPTNSGIVAMEAIKDRVIVHFALDTPESSAEAFITSTGGTIIGKIPAMRFYLVQVESGSEINYIEVMKSNPLVDYAKPDFTLTSNQYKADPDEGVHDFPYLQEINAPQAWDYLSINSGICSNIILGVIDLGFSYLNDDDFLFNGTNTSRIIKKERMILSTSLHGTSVASILAATGNNDEGNIGIDWESKIILIRNYNYNWDLALSIDKLVSDGATVINVSMGPDMIKNGTCDKGELEKEKEHIESLSETVRKINERFPENNFVIVKAAGNEGCRVEFSNFTFNKPQNLIIVGGSKHPVNGATLAHENSNYGNLIDIAAPFEVKIKSGTVSGTSFSAPQVAGAAALLWAHDPSLKTAADVAKRLKSTANKGLDCAGIQAFDGAGVLDIYAALKNNMEISNLLQSGGSIGKEYSQTLVVSGSYPTCDLEWSLVAGNLPHGLYLNTNPGIIYGTPLASGTYNFTVKVTDNTFFSVAKNFTIKISDLSISTSSLADGTVGTAFNQILSASGGTGNYTWSITPDNLPDGLISSGNVISGTPTTSGIYGFTVEVTDETGFKASKTFTITVTAPVEALAINTSTLSNGTVGSTYSQTLSATGGIGGYTWSISTGDLPAGLTLNNNIISGTPTTAGTYGFTVLVTDAGDLSVGQTFSITINSLAIPVATLKINAPSMTWIPRVSGTDKGLQAFASNGSKMLAAGMSGTILSSLDGINWTQENSGTTYNFYGATYANGLFVLVGAEYPGGPSVIVTSPDGVTWTERNLDFWTLGLNNVAYGNGVFVTVGNHDVIYTSTDGISWSFASNTAFTGEHLNDVKFLNNKFVAVGHNGRVIHSNDGVNWATSNTDGLSQLHGIAYGNGKYVASGQSDGAEGVLLMSNDLTNWTGINPAASSIIKRIAFDDNKFVGASGSGVLISTDGVNWELTSNVSVGEVGWDGSKFIAMGVNGTILTSSSAIPNGLVGAAYTADLSVNDGIAPYAWSVSIGALPPGLSLNSSTGVISGTPTAYGNYAFSVRVVDANGLFGVTDVVISIEPDYAALLPWSEMYGNSSNTSRSSLNGPSHFDNMISISVPGIIYNNYNNDPVLIGANNTVCFSFYCFDENGNIQRQLPARAGALANDGTLYAYYSGTIIALDRNGSEKWRYTVPYIITPPSLGPDGTIYFMNGYGYVAEYKSELFALNPDGTLKWKYMVNGPQREYQKYIAIGQEGNIYINAPDGNLLSLNPDGSLAWSISAFESWCGWSSTCVLRGAPVIGSDGTIYVTRGYSVLAVDPKGIVKWSTSLPGSTEGIPQLGPDGTFYIKTHQYKYDPVLGLIGSFSLSAVSPDGFIIWSKEKDIDISAIGNNGLLYGYEGNDVKIFDADANVIAVGPSKKGLLRLGFNETLFLKVFGTNELIKFTNTR